MKRILLFLLTCIIAISLFILPAAAAEDYAQYSFYHESCKYFDYFVSPGTYVFEFEYLNGEHQNVVSDPVVIPVIESDTCYDFAIFQDGSKMYSLQFCNVSNKSTPWELNFAASNGFPSFDDCDIRLTIRLVASGTSTPIEGTDSLLDNVGQFFTSCISMLSSVAAVIVANPLLSLLIIGMTVIGFVLIQLKRLK